MVFILRHKSHVTSSAIARCCHIAGVIDKKVSVTNVAGPWGGAQAEKVHFFVDQRFGRLELGKPLKDHNDQDFKLY